MAQKINTNSVRLKKRMNWHTFLNVQDFSKYANFFLLNNQNEFIIRKIFKKINYFTNSVLLTQDSKNTRSYSQLLHANDAQSSIDLKQASRKHFLLQQQKMFDNLNIVNKKNIISVSNFNVSRKDTKRFTFLSPAIITSFVADQLQKSIKLKNKSFSISLNVGILKLINTFLQVFQNNITGIKIICTGNWKKTKAGRKQKLRLIFGKMQKPTINNFIVFNQSAQTTKYGCLGIKVWISHKL